MTFSSMTYLEGGKKTQKFMNHILIKNLDYLYILYLSSFKCFTGPGQFIFDNGILAWR